MSSALVFVYGTLLRGEPNHTVLEKLPARFVARARTASPRTLVDLGPYPALLPRAPERDAAACPVHGELFEIDAAELPAVDAFEACPSLYRRERVDVVLEGDRESKTSAFACALAQPPDGCARVLCNGQWRQRTHRDG